jgi:hypothetical protein
MAKSPARGGDAPGGPSSARGGGGGSFSDRNKIGAARVDSTKRAGAVTGEEDTEDNEPTGGENVQALVEPVEDEDARPYDPEQDDGKPEEYIVLEGGTIDDGDGGDLKVCKAGDSVKLTPLRAAHFQKHGVPLESKRERDERDKKKSKRAA